MGYTPPAEPGRIRQVDAHSLDSALFSLPPLSFWTNRSNTTFTDNSSPYLLPHAVEKQIRS